MKTAITTRMQAEHFCIKLLLYCIAVGHPCRANRRYSRAPPPPSLSPESGPVQCRIMDVYMCGIICILDQILRGGQHNWILRRLQQQCTIRPVATAVRCPQGGLLHCCHESFARTVLGAAVAVVIWCVIELRCDPNGGPATHGHDDQERRLSCIHLKI